VKVERLLTALAFIFLTCALVVIAKTEAATGYEISIYAAYPVYFWFFLIAAFTIGILILVIHAFSSNESKWWLAGLAIVLLSISIILLLSYLRGYYGYDPTDTAGVLTYSRDIELSGHSWAGDFYPALHILAVTLSGISGIPLNIIMLILPVLFSILFIPSVFLLAKSLGLNHKACLLSIAFAAPPFFGEQVLALPRVLAFTFFPLFLCLVLMSWKVIRSPYTILLFLVVSFQIILHPINGGLLIIFILIILYIAVRIYHRMSLKMGLVRDVIPYISIMHFSIMIIVITVMWYAWLSQFQFLHTFVSNLISVSSWLGSQSAVIQDWAGKAQLTMADISAIFLKQHAHNFLYLALAFMAVVYLARKYKSRLPIESGLVFLMAVLVILFSVLTILAFVSPIRIEYWRVLPYALLPAMILAAWFFITVRSVKFKWLAVSGASALIIVGIVVGTFNIYPSPWVEGNNAQITHTITSGVSWFSMYQDRVSPIDCIGLGMDRVTGSVTGYAQMPQNIHDTFGYEIAPHLGYDKYVRYGEAYSEDHYLTLPAMAYVQYTERIPDHPSIWRWTTEELNQLHNDSSLSLIYGNSGFEVFYVEGIAKNVSIP